MKTYIFISQKIWLWIAIALPTLIVLPVILWPHYGLFSDAGQAITFPREILSNLPYSLSSLKPLDDGRWNPLFHGITILIYALAPDSPLAFYIAQWLFFVGAVLILSWIIFTFSSSSRYAILSAILFCFGSAVFENFFTLDKVEPRLVFFFALILVGMVNRLISKNGQNRWLSYVSLQLILGIFLVFSKESGVYVAVALIATFFACLLNPNWGSRLRLIIGVTAAVHASVSLLFMILFKILSSELSYRYIKYDLTTELIFHNLRYYILTSPELGIGLLFSLYWCIACVLRQLPGPSGAFRIILVFIAVSQIVYLAGLCAWRWPLDYYMLPGQYSACLIIGLSLYAFQSYLYKNRAITKILFTAFIFLWTTFIPERILGARAIYAQDAIKDQVADMLSDPKWRSSRVILPFKHPDNAEIGEQLEFFINLKRPSSELVDLYNFWELPVFSRDNLQRFAGGIGISPSINQLKDVSSHPERYVIWKFGSSSNRTFESKKVQEDGIFWNQGDIWRASYLHQGDLILVPVGDPSLLGQRARGISALHGHTLEDFLRKTPLNVTRVGGVTTNGWGPSLGWDLLRVERIDSDDPLNSFKLGAFLYTNTDPDITPMKSSKALVHDHKVIDQGLLLGGGWHELEAQKSERFRWMGPKSEIKLTKFKAGKCALDIDIEPLIRKKTPSMSLQLSSGKSVSTFALQRRENLHFEFFLDGALIQSLQLTTVGGLVTPLPGDGRILMARVFSLRLSGPCNNYLAQKK